MITGTFLELQFSEHAKKLQLREKNTAYEEF
jgi:hypothetical protein